VSLRLGWRRGATLAIALLAAAGAFAVFSGEAGRAREAVGEASPSVGSEAPDIQGMDANGMRITLSDYIGEPVLVRFWATWCDDCATEMPELERRFLGGGTKVRVIAVNVGETRGTVNEFAREHGLIIPMLVDATGKFAESYRVRALPATFVVGSDGKLIYAGVGPGLEGAFAAAEKAGS